MSAKKMNNYFDWLGWEVRDRVTGFTGVVSSVCIDLYGCVQGIVTPKVVAEPTGAQKLDSSHWFDLTRLELLGTCRVMEPIAPLERDAPGGFDKPLFRS
jgi:hypothetical protein